MKCKHSRNECGADISELSIDLYNKIITYDFEHLLNKAYDWLENYWDEYYSSKRGKAKAERLKYYIEYLENERDNSIYLKYPKIMDRIQL